MEARAVVDRAEGLRRVCRSETHRVTTIRRMDEPSGGAIGRKPGQRPFRHVMLALWLWGDPAPHAWQGCSRLFSDPGGWTRRQRPKKPSTSLLQVALRRANQRLLAANPAPRRVRFNPEDRSCPAVPPLRFARPAAPSPRLRPGVTGTRPQARAKLGTAYMSQPSCECKAVRRICGPVALKCPRRAVGPARALARFVARAPRTATTRVAGFGRARPRGSGPFAGAQHPARRPAPRLRDGALDSRPTRSYKSAPAPSAVSPR